jgi:hypothetical protein
MKIVIFTIAVLSFNAQSHDGVEIDRHPKTTTESFDIFSKASVYESCTGVRITGKLVLGDIYYLSALAKSKKEIAGDVEEIIDSGHLYVNQKNRLCDLVKKLSTESD